MKELQIELQKHYDKYKDVYSKEEYLKGEIKKLKKKIDEEKRAHDFVTKCLYTLVFFFFIYFIFFLC